MPAVAAAIDTAGARILDLGCDDDVPISRCLIRNGFDLVALDCSLEMIARYRANSRDVPTRCRRAAKDEFSRSSLTAGVAWGV